MWWRKGVDVVGHAPLCCRGCHPIAPLPPLPRSSSSFCLCSCTQCVYHVCSHGVSFGLVCFFLFGEDVRQVCVCLFCEHNCFHWPQCLCVRARARASCTVWNHSRLEQYWAPCPASLARSGRSRCGRSFPCTPQVLRALNSSNQWVVWTSSLCRLTVWACVLTA